MNRTGKQNQLRSVRVARRGEAEPSSAGLNDSKRNQIDGSRGSNPTNREGWLGGLMTDRFPPTVSLAIVRRGESRAGSSDGFTLLELVIVLAVALVIAAISLPIINKTLTSMHVTSSASTLAGIIQSTRYQAICTGCPYEIVLTPASNSYQILGESVVTSSTAPPVCATTYTPPVNSPVAVKFANSDVVFTISPSSTLMLNPSGTVTTTTSTTIPAIFTIVFSPTQGTQTKTITVSGVGNVRTQ